MTKLIKNIEVKGLNGKEENQLINSLKIFKDENIFLIKKSEILNSLSVFNFLDDISIQKVLPSKLIILTEKTIFLGITILDGKKFYIGKNGKLTPIFQVKKEQNLPLVFGNLKINEFLNLQKVLIKENIELNKINMDGTVVIGEGEMDEAPMLYVGEKVGNKNGIAHF